MLTSAICWIYLLCLGTVYGFPDSFINQDNVVSDEADISVSNIQEQLEKVLPQDKEGADARCELCKFILNYLDTYLKNNKTLAMIDATLHKLCNATTGALRITCLGAIPFIEKSIEQGLPPQKTCVDAGLCINKNSENTQPSTPKPALFHVPLQVQTGQASILKDQVNNVLTQNALQKDNEVHQKQLQQEGLQNTQIQQEQQQNQDSVDNQIKLGQGHLNLLPNSFFQKNSVLPAIQNNQIQQNVQQQPYTFQSRQNNQIQQTVQQQQGIQNVQSQQTDQKQPNQQTAFTRRNQFLGLMPGPVILQPNQIGTDNKLDKSEDGLQIEKVTTQPKQNISYSQKPPTSLSYLLGNKLTAFSQLLHKSTTSTSATRSNVMLNVEDGFLDVNKAETEDDDWYHIDDDEYTDEKNDGNKNDKQDTDNDWNFLTDNDNDDDSEFKDKIDIDQETPNQDQMNLETEWDTDKEKWDFKDFKSINIPSKPYFRELAVELNTRTNTDSSVRLNIIAFYGWILFMSFLMVACIILVRQKYKHHPNGHKQYTWKTAAEEGKSLMKNVYS